MANEKRLIYANAIPWEEHYVPDGDVQWEYKKELCVLKPTIDALPTVDAVEVVHGDWGLVGLACVCSVCHKATVQSYYYCHNCGAKMDGGKVLGEA